MSRVLAALIVLLSTVALGQESYKVDVYKILAKDSGTPQEIDPALAAFTSQFQEMRWKIFRLIEKVSKQVPVGGEMSTQLREDLTLTITLVEKVSDTKVRVKVVLFDEEEEKIVFETGLQVRLEASVLVGLPDQGTQKMFLGIEVE